MKKHAGCRRVWAAGKMILSGGLSGAAVLPKVRHQSSAEASSALYFSAFQLSDWHFGLHLFDNVRHQTQVVLHQLVPRL